MFFQTEGELRELKEDAEQEKADLDSNIEKASAYMRIKRGDDWDGSRVEIRSSLEQIQHRVRCRTAVRLQ